MSAGDELQVELHLTAEQAARGETTTLVATRLKREGTKLVLVDEELRLATPPGVQDGTTLRLPGMGHERTAGKRGDLVATVRVAARDRRLTLFLSPTDVKRGVRRTVPLGPASATTVTVPPGLDPAQFLMIPDGARGNLFVQLVVEPELASDAGPRGKLFTAERMVALGLGALGVWLLVAGFELPLSQVGEPEIRFHPQAFVVGLVGLALAVLLGVGGEVGELRGRRRTIALVAAVLVLAAGCGLTVLLVKLLESHGYRVR